MRYIPDNLGITVIVTAFNRHSYVIMALQSVIRQKREQDQIILLKNFGNEEHVEDFCNLNNIEFYTPEIDSVGEWYAFGIQKSVNNIISFLDDDDLFLDGKLDYVSNEFAKGDVICLRNRLYGSPARYLVIDRNWGKKEVKALHPSYRGMASIKNELLTNRSALSFSKAFLVSILDKIKPMTTMCEEIILIDLALESRSGKCIFSDFVGTWWYVHYSVSHLRTPEEKVKAGLITLASYNYAYSVLRSPMLKHHIQRSIRTARFRLSMSRDDSPSTIFRRWFDLFIAYPFSTLTWIMAYDMVKHIGNKSNKVIPLYGQVFTDPP
ncbi:MAG: glycosyltransferase [Thermoplasmatales archaeon]